MVFTILDTPRTEVGDQTRIDGLSADVDFSTHHPEPSPTRGGNDLLQQIRGMRPSARTPHRSVLLDRRNPPAKAEFTPLLKSASRNNFARSGYNNKENQRALQTPSGWGTRGVDSPSLMFNSVMEESTVTDQEDGNVQSLAPPLDSSSIASTPMPRDPVGALDARGNLATLREQEAIDKENFGLKLKIHFLMEALEKSGKDFNENAIRENTELKVDKVTLQRDVKDYRKRLALAEKSLAEYRAQLTDQAEKSKGKYAISELQAELDKLRAALAEKEAQLQALQDSGTSMDALEKQIKSLQDDVEDLNAELRDKDRDLEQKEEELENLRDAANAGTESEELQEKQAVLEEKEQEVQTLSDALQQARDEAERVKSELEDQLQAKEEQIEELEEQARSAAADGSMLRLSDQKLEARSAKMAQKDSEIAELKQQLLQNNGDKSIIRGKGIEVERSETRIHELETQSVEAKQLSLTVKDLSLELHTARDDLAKSKRDSARELQAKQDELNRLQSISGAATSETEKIQELQDQIDDLAADLREKTRQLDSKDDELDQLKEALEAERQQADDDLDQYEKQIDQLEAQQKQSLEELQRLRDADRQLSTGENPASLAMRDRLQQLESQQLLDKEHELELHRQINSLHDKIQRLEAAAREMTATTSQERQQSATERRLLEAAKARAEEQAASLQTTIAKLEHSEGTLTNRELQLQRLLDDERQRNKRSVASLEQERGDLQKDLERQTAAEERSKSLLRAKELELETLRQECSTVKAALSDCKGKLQALEDEIEVLQSAMDDEAEQAAEDVEAVTEEANSLRRELQTVRDQLSGPAKSGEALSVNEALPKRHERIKSPQPEPRPYYILTLETQRDVAVQQAGDLKLRLQAIRREHERQNQAQVLQYEQDIQNLEQDLADANIKCSTLELKHKTAEQQLQRSRASLTSLEQQAQQTGRHSPSAAERKDLHQMLKDAKLEAEDYALQVQEVEAKLATSAAKEADLRRQLNRVRDERLAHATRANVASAEVQALLTKQKELEQELAILRKGRKSRHANEDATQLIKRHAAELRGLSKQIEFLAARVKRADRFRSDLAYIKTYFTKQVEMHGKCVEADLRLVKAMGIPVDKVVEQERLRLEARAGRVRLSRRESRPSFKAVALTVLASVRMQRAAAGWSQTKAAHGVLMGKLRSVQEGRKRTSKR